MILVRSLRVLLAAGLLAGLAAAPVRAAEATASPEAPAAAPAPSGTTTVTDTANGYAMTVPYLVAPGENPVQVVSCVVLGPAVSGFSPNVNLSFQKPCSRKQFIDASIADCKARNWTLLSQKEVVHAGKEAIIIELEGAGQNGAFVRCKSLAVFTPDKVYLMTCTTLKANFEKHQKNFDACIQSFQLLAR